MTQIYIITGIIVLVCSLICYVFIRQTITKRNSEKKRLKRALDKRAKDLVQMLNSFPANFLPRDLQVFVYRCIIDSFEQLSKLDPSEPEYIEHFKSYTSNMESTMRAPKTMANVTFQSSTQINEIRQYLNYLSRFMQKWMQRGNINQKQYSHYKELLKKLITQLMVDNYTISAKQAIQIDKPKLAIHYFSLAKKALTKEELLTSKESRLVLVNEELKKLEYLVQQQESLSNNNQTTEEDNEDDKEWQKFEEDDDWKKKNIYD